MNRCPDCGKENPEDTHTCIEYERNRANELEQQLQLMHEELEALKRRVQELEHTAAGRQPWRQQQ